MKKTLTILLSLFIFAFSAVPSFASQSIKFTVSDSEVFAGDEFTVDIFISDYSRLKTATILVEYDKNAMQFLDLNIGAIVTAGSKAVSYKDVKNADKSYIQIDYNDSSASLSTAGKFLSLTFVAKDNAAGKTDVKLSVSGNKITTQSGILTPEFKNSKINIINNNPITETDTEPSSEGSTVSESSAPENAEISQNTSKTSSVGSSQNTAENSSNDKNKEKRNNRLIVGAVVTAIIVIAAMLFETEGKNGKRKKKSRKSKKRKTRR